MGLCTGSWVAMKNHSIRENNRIIVITTMIIKNAGKMRRIQERPCALKPQWISLGFINVTKNDRRKRTGLLT